MSHEIEKIRDDFAFHLERERNLSVHTIRAYLGDLDSLIEHLKTLKVTDLAGLTPYARLRLGFDKSLQFPVELMIRKNQSREQF